MSGIAYAYLWVACQAIARLCFRFRVRGLELVPKQGGLLIAANHASYLDIPLVGCGLRRRACGVAAGKARSREERGDGPENPTGARTGG